VREHVRSGVENLPDEALLALEVRDETLDEDGGVPLFDRPDGVGEVARALVGQVVPVDRREDDVVQPDVGDGVGDVLGFLGVEGFHPAGLDVAEVTPREHRSPISMKVAVPGPSRPLQHSPMFGQLASSQTVCRSRSRSDCLISVNRSPDGGRIFSQSGLRVWLIGYGGWDLRR